MMQTMFAAGCQLDLTILGPETDAGILGGLTVAYRAVDIL